MNQEPVVVGNIITVVFTLFGAALAKWGITESDANQLVALVGTVLSAVIVVVNWFRQRSKVTPLVNPMNNDGQSLVPFTPLEDTA